MTSCFILATFRYADNNYQNRVNWYSNPNIKYSGIPTGDVSNNNAQNLIQRRFLMSAVGNEAISCTDGLFYFDIYSNLWRWTMTDNHCLQSFFALTYHLRLETKLGIYKHERAFRQNMFATREWKKHKTKHNLFRYSPKDLHSAGSNLDLR